jgi:hypothetical protein
MGPDRGSITITSHRGDDDATFERTRESAPMNPYLASLRGKAAQAGWDHERPPLGPTAVVWTAMTIPVDGTETHFEMCDLGEGFWVAVGRSSGATISIDSREVPLSVVSLERIGEKELPALRPPDLNDRSEVVLRHLEQRFHQVPFERIRGEADYWALVSVESDHMRRLAQEYNLSENQRKDLQRYWLERIEEPLSDMLKRFHYRGLLSHHRSPIARHLQWNWLYQLWFNTVGPGARCWFGNRYTTIRHYTFRIRWRP